MKRETEHLVRKTLPPATEERSIAAHKDLDALVQRVAQRDVFVPRSLLLERLGMQRIVFYSVLDEHELGVVIVRGSALTAGQVEAQRKVLEGQAAADDRDERDLARALRLLDQSTKRGLVEQNEAEVWRLCTMDPKSKMNEIRGHRVYCASPGLARLFADELEKSGFLIVPVLPAYWFKELRWPVDDARFGEHRFVHFESRCPCPWAIATLRRGDFK